MFLEVRLEYSCEYAKRRDRGYYTYCQPVLQNLKECSYTSLEDIRLTNEVVVGVGLPEKLRLVRV